MLRFMDSQGEPERERLMLLAHNPGMSELFEYFSGQPHSVPTAAAAVFKRSGAGSWLAPESWTLIDLLLPRELMA